MFSIRRSITTRIYMSAITTKAVLKIPDGELLEGDLPSRQMKPVQAWIELHQEDLMADWHLAITRQTPFKIDPLR